MLPESLQNIKNIVLFRSLVRPLAICNNLLYNAYYSNVTSREKLKLQGENTR